MKTNALSLFDDDRSTATYNILYEGLAEMRDEFHRSGRLDDSNAKLDEVVKLFATYLAFRLGDITDFPKAQGNSDHVFVEELQRCFITAALLPYYIRQDGFSIFGSNPSLAITESQPNLARQLTSLVIRAVDAAFYQQDLGNPYDVLNEVFGHFVRDNFRGNIEDAQYLTPAEVVEFVVNMSLNDLRMDGRCNDVAPLIVADPCCGVGSFLTTFASKYRICADAKTPQLELYGQDKVERMVRLTTINLTLFKVFKHNVSIGNSLYEGSPLDILNGTVDVVLTNPPFGARFSQGEIASMAGDNTPFFTNLPHARRPLESELLFVDRDLRLLRDGGRLYIVVPDGVVSTGGVAGLLRHHIKRVASLEAVIELPSVTFAQAGTRTKTAVLCLRKLGHRANKQAHSVFMAVSKNVGFQVNSRKGVQVKVESGENELPALLSAYQQMRSAPVPAEAYMLSKSPLAVVVPSISVHDTWTPGHYQVNDVDASQNRSDVSDVQNIPLIKLVEFVGDERRAGKYQPGTAFISVLHIVGEGIFDFAAMKEYAPITPGIPIKSGEVLISRINPRIPRVLVVPELGKPMLCSSEFEVMRPRDGIDPFLLAFLLLSKSVQSQIQGLTSGTSASHNRIKRRELASVCLPIPQSGTMPSKQLSKLVAEYRQAVENLTAHHRLLLDIRERETDWLS